MSKKLLTFIGDRKELHSVTRQMDIPSMLSGEIGMVLCEQAQVPYLKSKLSIIGEEEVDASQFFPGHRIQVESFFSFNKRQTVGKVERPGRTHKTISKAITLGANEAFNKFLKSSGLQPASSHQYGGRATPLEPLFIHGQPMYNTFYIKGEFVVQNVDLFRHALLHGVGGRKSYGFGLIVAKPCL